MTKTRPTHKKLLARVLYISPEVLATARPTKQQAPSQKPTALIQCDAPAQAKQIVRAAEFLRLPEEEQLEVAGEALYSDANWSSTWAETTAQVHQGYKLQARAVLAAMGMGGAKQ